MKYRPEIDGLRAVAVISVVVYHANEALFPGGYLGVDVFLVLSGFLITQVIVGDLKTDRFTFTEFYERRARRILPAFYVVLAATIPFAILWMLPSQKIEFAQSVLATTLFSSNFLFWSETGYFMAASEFKPLLHTWSLAVEEQFYFIYPLLIVGLWKFARRYLIPTLVVIFLASLAGSIYMAEHAPAANFYLLPSRTWELLAGALVALVPWRPSKGHGLLASLGLIAVLVSFAILDTSTPIPSAYALPLVLGTQLLLMTANATTFPGRILAFRPLVGIGLISYSAYLWHLPMFAFARIRTLGNPDPNLLAILAVTSFVFAYISYRLVEKPFRQRGEGAFIPRIQLVTILVMGGVFFAGYGLLFGVFRAQLTFPSAVSSTLTPAEVIEAKVATNYGLSSECEGEFTLSEACRTDDTPEILIWGDSFAMHLVEGVQAGAGWDGIVQLTKSVCMPAVGISVITSEYPTEWSEGCITFNDSVIAWLRTQDSIKTVITSSPFGIIHNDIYMRDGTIVSDNQAELVRQQLVATARLIEDMGKSMVIVSPPPVTGADLGQCLAGAMLQGLPPETCDFTTDKIHSVSRSVYSFLHTLDGDVPVLYLDHLMCIEGVCDTMIGDTFMFRDAGHLSIEGSRYLGESLNLYGLIEELAQE